MKVSQAENSKNSLALHEVIKSQKQTFDALMRKYNKLNSTFEEVLVEKFAIKELRDFWRERAGTINE